LNQRQSEIERIRNNISYSEVIIHSLQQIAASLDNDSMQTSRLWEAVFSSAMSIGDYMSGRVMFQVPSAYFDALGTNEMVDAMTMEQVLSELNKIIEYIEINKLTDKSELIRKIHETFIYKINSIKNEKAFK
jgi:hypothetical protein